MERENAYKNTKAIDRCRNKRKWLNVTFKNKNVSAKAYTELCIGSSSFTWNYNDYPAITI